MPRRSVLTAHQETFRKICIASEKFTSARRTSRVPRPDPSAAQDPREGGRGAEQRPPLPAPGASAPLFCAAGLRGHVGDVGSAGAARTSHAAAATRAAPPPLASASPFSSGAGELRCRLRGPAGVRPPLSVYGCVPSYRVTSVP